MIKAAFFDVDGTLYSHTMNKLPESALKALGQLKEKGIKIFLATGRSFQESAHLPWGDVVFDGYVTLNGQICTDAEGNIIFGTPIQGEDAENLLSAFIKKEMPLMIIEEDRMYINYIDDSVRRAQESVEIQLPTIGTYHGADVYQFIAYITREEEAAFLEKIPNCKLTRWYEGGVDIIAKESGKMVGIKKMLEIHGIEKEEVIAFGDGDNDADMLDFVGVGVAMGNAVEITKEKADYVTDHIDDDGIWNALKHFEII